MRKQKKKPKQTLCFRDLLNPSDPLMERKLELIELCLEAKAERSKTRQSLCAYAQDIADEEAAIYKLLFPGKEKNGAGILSSKGLAFKLVKDLKQWAFKDRFVSKFMVASLHVVWDKSTDMKARKIAKKYLVEVLNAMLPNLKKEKSSRQFDGGLITEFNSIKQALVDSGLKQSGRSLQNVNKIIRGISLKELSVNQWSKILQPNDTQITYAILAAKYLTSSPTIEKNIKKQRRESRQLQALGNLFSSSIPQ